MATFKSILKSGISNPQILYTTPTGVTTILLSGFIANKEADINEVSLYIRREGQDYYILYNIPLAIGSTLQPTDGRKVVLQPADILYISTTAPVDVVMSIIENVLT